MFKTLIAAGALIILFGANDVWATERCQDLTGKYDCPGCEARLLSNDIYKLSNGCGWTTAEPVQGNNRRWSVQPNSCWGSNAPDFYTKGNCKTLDFGGGGLWHWLSE
jgi:hypothetical protein